jgi:hypothetical protein
MNIRAKLREVPDPELLDLLDAVSEELKRRNEILGPSVSEVKTKTPEENLKTLLTALAELGGKINFKKQL